MNALAWFVLCGLITVLCFLIGARPRPQAVRRPRLLIRLNQRIRRIHTFLTQEMQP